MTCIWVYLNLNTDWCYSYGKVKVNVKRDDNYNQCQGFIKVTHQITYNCEDQSRCYFLKLIKSDGSVLTYSYRGGKVKVIEVYFWKHESTPLVVGFIERVDGGTGVPGSCEGEAGSLAGNCEGVDQGTCGDCRASEPGEVDSGTGVGVCEEAGGQGACESEDQPAGSVCEGGEPSPCSKKYYTYTKLQNEYKTKKCVESLPSGDYQESCLCPLLSLTNAQVNKAWITFRELAGNDAVLRVPTEKECDPNITVGYKVYYYIPDGSEKETVITQERLFKDIKGRHEIHVKNIETLNGQRYSNVNIYYPVKTTSGAGTPKDAVLIQFIGDGGSNNYYFKRLDKDGTYWETVSASTITYQGYSQLEEKLAPIKTTADQHIVFRIEHRTTSDYNGSVTVNEQCNTPGDGFTSYKHTPTEGAMSSYVLYNWKELQKKCTGGSSLETLNEIQGQKYTLMTVYYGGETKLPLMIKLEKLGGADYYKHCKDKSNYYWEQVKELTGPDNGQLVVQLAIAQFDLVKSIVILLEKKSGYGESQVGPATISTPNLNKVDNNTINVNNETRNLGCLTSNNYKVFKHEIKQAVNGGDGKFGFRFYIPQTDSSYNELTLMESGKKEYIYYTSGKNDLFVYFYGSDPRPLLLCYGDKVYRPKDKDNYGSEWVKAEDVEQCLCDGGAGVPTGAPQCPATTPSPTCPLLKTLMCVSDFLNPVNIHKSGEYDIQTFNGQDIQIKYSKEEKPNCYYKVTHTPNGGYRLGTVEYNNTPIQDTSGSNISAGGYDDLVVFYLTADTNLLLPLLLALKSGSNYCPYYKLEDKAKKYKKVTTPINLSDGSLTLIDTLDKLNYRFRKSLIVDLSQQGNYTPRLVDNLPTVPFPTGTPGRDNLTVSTCTTTITTNGYACYEHLISSYGNLKEVGGLKMQLYEGKFITLFEYRYFVEEKQATLYYTRCKGDVLVFFYQHESTKDSEGPKKCPPAPAPASPPTEQPADTVPLMFYFNKFWYAPTSKDDYFTRWEKVKELNGVTCEGVAAGVGTCPSTAPTTTTASNCDKVKCQLERVNKMLNEIQLEKCTSYGIPSNCLRIQPRDFNPLRVCVCKCDPSKPKKDEKEEEKEKTRCEGTVPAKEEPCKGEKVPCPSCTTPSVPTTFYVSYTHTTKNKGPIGEIRFNARTSSGQGGCTSTSITLEGIKYSDYGSERPNQVTVYYMRLDTSLLYPLAICVPTTKWYTLYYALTKIEGNTYTYKKTKQGIMLVSQELEEQMLLEVAREMDNETQQLLLKLLRTEKKETFEKLIASNEEAEYDSLSKSILPVGSIYLLAGGSMYSLGSCLRTFRVRM